MDHHTAREFAAMLDAEPCSMENGSWIVVIARADGRFVAVSETSVEEYPDREALASGRCYACIGLI